MDLHSLAITTDYRCKCDGDGGGGGGELLWTFIVSL